jgi:hypothetical protein
VAADGTARRRSMRLRPLLKPWPLAAYPDGYRIELIDRSGK